MKSYEEVELQNKVMSQATEELKKVNLSTLLSYRFAFWLGYRLCLTLLGVSFNDTSRRS